MFFVIGGSCRRLPSHRSGPDECPGQIDVSYQLFDVATQSQLQRQLHISRDQWRDVDTIADLVYTKVTGVRNSTKILYVLLRISDAKCALQTPGGGRGRRARSHAF